MGILLDLLNLESNFAMRNLSLMILVSMLGADVAVPTRAPVLAPVLAPVALEVPVHATIATPVKQVEADLSMPTCPVATGELTQIVVTGIPPASLPKLRYCVAPSDGTTLLAGQGLKPGDPTFMAFRALNAGIYTFVVAAPDGTGELLFVTKQLTVNGSLPPKPPGPIPDPGPKPPTPDPKPPAPVEPTKLRVLLVYDETEIIGMTEDQRQVIYSNLPGSFRAYVEDHCIQETVTDSTGGKDLMPARRLWSLANATSSNAGPLWVPLVKAANGKSSLVVQAGETITRFDFPASNKAAVETLVPLGGK